MIVSLVAIAAVAASVTANAAAVREILEMTDPHAFLERSGWYPGIALAPLVH